MIYIWVEVAIGKNLYKYFKNVYLLGCPKIKKNTIKKDHITINECYIAFL